MKSIIVGCGRVGAALAQRLVAAGHDVTVVDQNVGAFSRLGDDFGGHMLIGNALDPETLRRAGAQGADTFAAITNGDNRNLMIAQMARHLFEVQRVIARLYDPIRSEIFRELGLETFCSTTIGAGIVAGYFASGENRAVTFESAVATGA